MDKIKIIESVYQKGSQLVVSNPIYKKRVLDFALGRANDDFAFADITSQTLFSKQKQVKAVIKTQENGLVCGLDEIGLLYHECGIKFEQLCLDGSLVRRGQILAKVSGNAIKILSLERTVLNILRFLSGITTTTNKFVQLLNGHSTMIAATRKTLAEEYMEKRAVSIAGGLTHRLGLNNHIMIKDCHLDIIGFDKNPIEISLKKALSTKYPVEIEVSNLKSAVLAAQIFKHSKQKNPKIIMLDNFLPKDVKTTLDILKKEKKMIIFESSGGITLNNIQEYAKTGVDIISTSSLTESSKILNIHQKIVK